MQSRLFNSKDEVSFLVCWDTGKWPGVIHHQFDPVYFLNHHFSLIVERGVLFSSLQEADNFQHFKVLSPYHGENYIIEITLPVRKVKSLINENSQKLVQYVTKVHADPLSRRINNTLVPVEICYQQNEFSLAKQNLIKGCCSLI